LDTFNDQDDRNKGRLALWLTPKDLQILINEYRKIPSDAPVLVRDAWSRIAIRASTALHMADIPLEPSYPEADERYQLAASLESLVAD
jgi:hypothetical protein